MINAHRLSSLSHDLWLAIVQIRSGRKQNETIGGNYRWPANHSGWSSLSLVSVPFHQIWSTRSPTAADDLFRCLVDAGSIKTKQWWQTYHSWEILSGHRHRMNEGDILCWLLIHAGVLVIITAIDLFQQWWAIVYAMHKWRERGGKSYVSRQTICNVLIASTVRVRAKEKKTCVDLLNIELFTHPCIILRSHSHSLSLNQQEKIVYLNNCWCFRLSRTAWSRRKRKRNVTQGNWQWSEYLLNRIFADPILRSNLHWKRKRKKCT